MPAKKSVVNLAPGTGVNFSSAIMAGKCERIQKRD